MTSINTRSSALALTEEVTPGVPVAPTAPTDFIALQDDFSMEPGTETLENAELKDSIAPGKPIIGREQPTASTSHYLRHSGQSAVSPNYRLLIKSAFGEETIAGSEGQTDTGSTVSVLKVPAGEGLNYRKGQALMVQGPSGYEIRCIKSISGDDLTLAFDLNNAPGSGVNLGQAVTYSPVKSGHPTLSAWHYLGNPGAVQLMTGALVTDMTIDISAGELINSSYSLEGLGYFFNPVIVTTSNQFIDVTDDDGTFAATVAPRAYKDPHDFAKAVEAALNAAATSQTYSVSYGDKTGLYTIQGTGTLLSLLWNTGANTANSAASILGFDSASDSTGASATTGYVSANVIDLSTPVQPTFDDSSPLAAKGHQLLVGAREETLCVRAATVSFPITNTKSEIGSICAESGVGISLITGRASVATVEGILDTYDAARFRQFRTGEEISLQYAFGNKDGGNWQKGKSGALYLAHATVSSITIGDSDGIATLSMEISSFAPNDGSGEAFISFV